MSTFTLKIIAILSMLVDHVAAYLQLSNSSLLSHEILSLMRSFGRMALPIFAYFIVIGYSKTSNLKKYIGRIHLFALISQIPFTLAFDHSNYHNFYEITDKLVYIYDFTDFIFVLITIVAYYYFICDKKFDFSLVYVSFAYIITPLFMRYDNIILLTGKELNIFYELGVSLILIALLDRLKYYLSVKSYLNILINIISIIAIYFYVGSIANYGFFAIFLVLILRLLMNQKIAQSIIILLWGYSMYGYSWISFGFVVFTSILLYFYNGKKGPSIKYLFYIFYPIHLTIVGLLNII